MVVSMKQYTALAVISLISGRLKDELKDVQLTIMYAWLLVELVTKKSKIDLIVAESIVFTGAQSDLLNRLIDDIVIRKKPLDYIIGFVPFCDLTIFVAPPILIPRPETEEWVTNLIERLKNLSNKKIAILDIGTGSGCIGLALAAHLPQAQVVAIDIADSALELAKKNSLHNGIKNITFLKSDLFAAIPQNYSFDIIVSNPPYIAELERKSLDLSVVEWEDERALFAHGNGLAVIKDIVNKAPSFIYYNHEIKMRNIGQLIVEIGYSQGLEVADLMKRAGYSSVCIYKDLGKKDRIVSGRIDSQCGQ